MQQTDGKQLGHDKAESARGVKLIHIRNTIRVDATQLRHDFREFRKVLPVDENASSSGDRNEVHRMIGGAPGCQQTNDAVNQRLLTDNLGKRAVVRAQVRS